MCPGNTCILKRPIFFVFNFERLYGIFSQNYCNRITLSLFYKYISHCQIKQTRYRANLLVFSHRKYKCAVAPALAYTMCSAYCLLMTRCNYVLSAIAYNAYSFVGKQTIQSIGLLYKSYIYIYTYSFYKRIACELTLKG